MFLKLPYCFLYQLLFLDTKKNDLSSDTKNLNLLYFCPGKMAEVGRLRFYSSFCLSLCSGSKIDLDIALHGKV